MEIARRILKEINDRLRFLVDVGLEYLNLSRGSGTLSGGESQRIRLAARSDRVLPASSTSWTNPPSVFISGITPGCSLPSRPSRPCNSVLVVEHDEEAILAADYVIDMGPAAGVHGGKWSPKALPPTSWPVPPALPAST